MTQFMEIHRNRSAYHVCCIIKLRERDKVCDQHQHRSKDRSSNHHPNAVLKYLEPMSQWMETGDRPE